MRYMRKTPVEAIQWNPDNRKEFAKFVEKYTKNYATFEYTNGNILLCYWDFNSRKHITEIPKGRLFLYNVLKENGILPLMEQQNAV